MNEVVSAAWDKVVEQWDDRARHDALRALVVQHNAFTWVAAKYKERAGDPIADEQIKKLQGAAIASMMATSTARKAKEDSSPNKRAMMWLLLFLVLMLFGLLAAKLMANAHHTPQG